MATQASPAVGDILELEIERMSFGPAAVARYQIPGASKPVVVFVRGAAPQDVVRAKITKCSKNFWDAQAIEVLKPSPLRVTPPCSVFDQCGGCQWQHMSYDAQVSSKKDVLLHQIQRATQLDGKFLDSITTVHAAPNPLGYRTRIQARGDAKGLGFYQESSRQLIHVNECIVCHPKIREAWSQFLENKPLKQLSQNKMSRDDLDKGQFKVEWTLTESGDVLEAINREHAALGFTQINPEQNEVMIRVVSELATSQGALQGNFLLDLYAGAGNLSKGLTRHFTNVICVEAYAPQWAKVHENQDSLATSLAPGQTLIRERVESFLKAKHWQQWGFKGPDCIIADPPRAGLEGTAAQIASLKAKRVVLVSCEPSTLARDLREFLPHYEMESIHLVDMFPQTYHIEAVVGLRLKG